MPLIHKAKKELALALRSEGKSYREIQKATELPSRSTLSLWFKDLVLPEKARLILEDKKKRAEKNILKFSKERSILVQKENRNITKDAVNELGSISKRDLLLLGAALYWGEGSLRPRNKAANYYFIAFSNSSPEMVTVFMKFLRDILRVPDSEMRPQVQYHLNIQPKEAVRFWAKVTQLPESIFKSYLSISSASKGKRPAHFLPYGTFQIRCNKRKYFYMIRGYIDGIIKNLIY